MARLTRWNASFVSAPTLRKKFRLILGRTLIMGTVFCGLSLTTVTCAFADLIMSDGGVYNYFGGPISITVPEPADENTPEIIELPPSQYSAFSHFVPFQMGRLLDVDGSVSDWLYTNAEGALIFQSGGTDPLIHATSDLGSYIETGSPQLFLPIAYVFGAVPIFVTSDVDVPEPTTLIVWAGLGLVSLGFVSLQKKYSRD